MLSKSHLHIKRLLERICKAYKISLYCDLKEGSKRYDFYIPTSPPIVIEIDGAQHDYKSADGFFFKNLESLRKYKQNDAERNKEHKIGKIILYRFKDDYFPSISEFLEDLGQIFEEKMNEGENEENAYVKSDRRNKEYNEERKRKNKEYRQKLKERNSGWS